MRILHITDGIPPRVLGGTGRIVWETARELARSGHETAVLSASPNTEATVQDGVTLLHIPVMPLRWAHYRSVWSDTRAQEILTHIDAFKPDVIHAHTVAWQCGYRWMHGAKARGIPVIMTFHDVMSIAYGRVMGDEQMLWPNDIRRARWTYNPLRNHAVRNAVATCRKRLCVSDVQRAFLEQHGLKNMQTLHNGIDVSFWKPQDQKAARTSLKLPIDKPIFLLAGRLGVDKGMDIVVQTMPPDAHLIVAGSAPQEAFKKLGNRFHYYHDQSAEELRTLYAASDAVLVPSVCLDCFPTICLEAMACERPVIATTFGGAKESVKDDETGWITDPRSQDFLQRLQWCCDHRTELPGYGQKGRARVTTQFALNDNVDRLEEMYRS